MLELIPSRDVREHLKEIGHEFTDAEKATIIYNIVEEVTRRNNLLKQLAGTTSDSELRTQIEERLDFDKRSWQQFIEDDRGCYYTASYLDFDEEWDTAGSFAGYKLAKLKIEELEKEQEGSGYKIEKYQILGEKENVVKGYYRTNRRLLNLLGNTGENSKPCYEEYDIGDFPISKAEYNSKGQLIDFYSAEMPIEEVEKMEDWGEARFEDKFIYIPTPFKPGEVVCSVKDPQTLGVIDMALEHIEWLKEMAHDDFPKDWTDVSVQVLFLHEDNSLSHDHINPLYLQRAETLPFDFKDSVLYMAGKAIKGETSLSNFIDVYENYRQGGESLIIR